MTEVIIYTLDLMTLLVLIVAVPILLVICEFLWYEGKDRWIKRDYKLVHKMRDEMKKYQELRWEIEEDIEYARESYNQKKKDDGDV